MNDGWVSVYQEVPAAGQTVEICVGNSPTAIEGGIQGVCKVKVSPPLGEDWIFTGRSGEKQYILYWRRVQ
jgi:hypothetical protein